MLGHSSEALVLATGPKHPGDNQQNRPSTQVMASQPQAVILLPSGVIQCWSKNEFFKKDKKLKKIKQKANADDI